MLFTSRVLVVAPSRRAASLPAGCTTVLLTTRASAAPSWTFTPQLLDPTTRLLRTTARTDLEMSMPARKALPPVVLPSTWLRSITGSVSRRIEVVQPTWMPELLACVTRQSRMATRVVPST